MKRKRFIIGRNNNQRGYCCLVEPSKPFAYDLAAVRDHDEGAWLLLTHEVTKFHRLRTLHDGDHNGLLIVTVSAFGIIDRRGSSEFVYDKFAYRIGVIAYDRKVFA